MKQHNLRAPWSVLLALLLCTQLAAPAFAAPAEAVSETTLVTETAPVPQTASVSQMEYIYIASAGEFQALARECTLDTWSQNKTVTLTGDISLADVEAPYIPSFGGVFDGGGHTISGVNLSGGVSPIGLFGTIQSGAVVKNLHVRGSIAPGGTRDVAGGIAGINGGAIENCSFTGTVSGGNSVGGLAGVNDVTGVIRDSAGAGSITGKSMTGGIAGRNLGVISGCRNSARVNITSVDPSLDLSELDLGAAVNLRDRNALDTVNVATDTGGIAGYSTGMILSCTNLAVIGYQHIGYNVGGIAGRSCGHIANCENQGAVLGRKDIGGIVGQAEPYIILNLSAGQIDSLRGNLDRLQELVDGALDDADASGSDLSDSLNGIGSAVDAASGYAEDLGRHLTGFGDSTITEINRGSAVLADTISRLDGMSGDLTALSGTFTEGLDGLGSALEELSGIDAAQAADDLLAASEALRGASEPVKNGVSQINRGIDALQAAIRVKDTGRLEAAGDQISGGLSQLAGSASTVSAAFQALSNALNAAGGLDSAGAAAQDLAAACGKMAGGLQQIGTGAQALAGSLVVEDQDAVEAALAELRTGAKTCAQAAAEASKAAGDLLRALGGEGGSTDGAMEALRAAADQLSTGMGQVEEALTKLEGNISVDDDKAQAALETMRGGLNAMTQGADQATKALDALNAALGSADMDGALSALGTLSGGVSQMSRALEQMSAGVQGIQNGLTVDTGAVSGGIDTVQSGVDTLLGAVDAMDQASAALERALTGMQASSGQMDQALDSLAEATENFQAASDQGTGVFRQVQSLFDYLDGVDPIQITYPAEEIDAAADGLFGAMDQVSGRMNALNTLAQQASGTLSADLRAVSTQLQQTMTSLLDAIDEAEHRTGGEVVSDTSQEDIDAVTSGKILSCANHGEVDGDINVGGVAGAMAVERELDPEDDLSAGAPIYRREYELKAILQKCVNDGTVTSRRDYAGGVCGRADLGLVTRCEGYGTITSESGDYVGGVAGFSGGTVRDSFAKCWLSGGDYVGGITGASADGEAGGTVSRCCSLVRITEHGQYAGAISGSSQGTFQDNYFVSNTLAGLDQASLSGRAQAMDYDQLLQVEGLPEAFKHLTLRFLAQTGGDTASEETAQAEADQVVKELEFHYGDSFGPEVFPDIPPVEGCYGAWDTQDLSDLRFDTDVTAVYTPYITALSGGGRRDDGRSVFLAEGLFSSEDEFTAEQVQLPEERTAGLSGMTFLSRRALLEIWTLAGEAHTVRYLSPSGSTEGVELYALEPAGWVKLDTGTAGSYLTVPVSDTALTLAVVSRTSIWWILILTAVLALAAVCLILVWIIRRRRTRKLRKEAQNVKNAPRDGGKPAELVSSGADAASGRKKKGRRALRAAVIVLLVLAAAVAVFFATGLKDDVAAYLLLKRYIGTEEQSAQLTVEVQAGESRHHMDIDISKTQVDHKSVTCAEQYGATVYYCDGLLYLENGQAIEAGGAALDLPDLLSGVYTLYKGSNITVFENQEERIYRVRVDGDAAMPVLESILPSVLNDLTQVDLLDVSLVEHGGKLARLLLEAEGVSAQAPVSVSAELTATDGDGEVEIPTPVREQIESGNREDSIAGEDVFRLLESWIGLNARDPLVSDVSLTADCGPLVLDEELEWSRTHAGGVEVNSIRKNGRTYYFSTGNVYDDAGDKEDAAGSELFSPENLLTLAYRLCVSGEISCARAGETYTYSLDLDEKGMAGVARAILPDTEGLDLHFQSGSVQITVGGEGIERISFSCGGSVKVMVVDVPVSLEAELRFRDPSQAAEPEVPGEVLTELSRPAQ